jgi:hypothetical protein
VVGKMKKREEGERKMERESTTSIVTVGEGGRADQRREARPRRQGKVEEGCEWLARYYMYIECSVGTYMYEREVKWGWQAAASSHP